MSKARPKILLPWTQADDDDNSRRIQREADRKTWERLGRLVGLRGRDLAAALGRMLDDRIAAALRAQKLTLLDQLTNPAQADALRDALGDLLCEDIAKMVQILLHGETDDDSRNP